MAEDPKSTPQIGDPGMDPTSGTGPGSGDVGIFGIVALTTYLVLFTLFLIYALIVVWPVPTPSGQPDDTKPAASPSSTPNQVATVTPPTRQTAAPTPTPTSTPTPTPTPIETGRVVRETAAGASPSPGATPQPTPRTFVFLGRQFKLWDEQQLILLVLLAGALGSILHSLRSVYWYIGNRSLVRSWMAMYIVLPFAGATLALIFYLVVRGGFFSPQSSFKETSPFGFAAFAALIGMFSPQAVLKLREVAETLLSKPKPGPDAKPQETLNPGAVRTPPTVPENKPPTPPAGENPPVEK